MNENKICIKKTYVLLSLFAVSIFAMIMLLRGVSTTPTTYKSRASEGDYAWGGVGYDAVCYHQTPTGNTAVTDSDTIVNTCCNNSITDLWPSLSEKCTDLSNKMVKAQPINEPSTLPSAIVPENTSTIQPESRPSTAPTDAAVEEKYNFKIKLTCANYVKGECKSIDQNAYKLTGLFLIDKPGGELSEKNEYLLMTSQCIETNFARVPSQFTAGFFNLIHSGNEQIDATNNTRGIRLSHFPNNMKSYDNTQVSWNNDTLPKNNYTIEYKISDEFCKL